VGTEQTFEKAVKITGTSIRRHEKASAFDCVNGHHWRSLVRLPNLSQVGLEFYVWTFFLLINPPCSAAAQWMAIKCISDVRS